MLIDMIAHSSASGKSMLRLEIQEGDSQFGTNRMSKSSFEFPAQEDESPIVIRKSRSAICFIASNFFFQSA